MAYLNLEDELETVKYLAEEADKEILKIFHSKQDLNIENKTDNSPVTIADKASNKILVDGLCSRFPDYGLLSEETLDNLDRLNKEFVWIIDPLDGTRDFIARQRSFTVMVGLARKGEPVLGVVHSPVERKTYSAIKGRGAHILYHPCDNPFGDGNLYGTERKIIASSHEKVSEMKVMIVRTKLESEGFEQLVQMPFSGISLIGGSGYKAMMIAE